MKSHILLDSGAYSADQQGTEIDINEYMDYIRKSGIKYYLNLDVIGDDDASWDNQRIMESNGLSPLPVYHIEDKPKYLDLCIENYDYFALGGMAGGVHENERQRFLDGCFDKICDTSDRLPKNKVHGLGLASPLLVARYPWASVDTASGIHYGRYGIIIIPQRNRRGELNYLVPPHSLYVTERSTAKQHEGHHFCNLSPDEQETIKNYAFSEGFEWGRVDIINVEPGYELLDNEKFIDKTHEQIERVVEDGIISNGILRDYFNINFYMHMEEAIPEWPWAFRLPMKRMF